ncbi:LysR family transcriptional regulator [Stutzerimonas zhaodongensis]|uniref:LysR family transcriptional regulator n=1 Tax=Stutzerimonas zhaodongensis TaxID=1176257 RepID=A0A3M2HF66_9GAMM|nr:LysR family transcriptional regulator [Stutzerimonas zhaodongensis]MCQ4317768.1 LysR family transcriptional regulator [Stutzerimonas zhaodongensis]RMH87588.1 LysR family transcriptional regulator [Stutzerimonas zhaodongensis]
MTKALASGLDRIDLLRTFIRIVDAGSLSAAAAQLSTSQPTVSRRLKALEQSLGLQLLNRSTHSMQLTGDGERCYAFARQVLDSWGEMEAELLGARDDPRGTLRVQVPHAFGQDQLIAPLGEYLRQYPNVSVEWVLHDRRPYFTAEGIDCAIQVGVIEDPSVVAIRLGEIPRIVVVAPEVLGPGALPNSAEQLQRLPWLALRTYYTDEVVLNCLADGRVHKFSIQPRMSTDSLYALRGAALEGLGACVSSAWVVARDIEQGRLIQLIPQWQAAPLPVYLIYPHARSHPAKLRLFADLIRKRMPNLVGLRRA